MVEMKGNSTITISNIAKKAGVSPALVSSVLGGGKSSIRCSDVTRNKVLKVASKLNYHIREANTFGLIHLALTHAPSDGTWVHWIAPLLGSIHLQALNSDKLMSVFAYSLEELDKQLKNDDLPQVFMRRKIDGLIITGAYSGKIIKYLDDINMPWVFMNMRDSQNYSQDSICFDEIFTGTQATRYLLKNGYKKNLHASVKGKIPHYSEFQRLQGYNTTMDQAGYDSRYAYLVDEDFDSFKKNITEMLTNKDRPDAIFAYNERVAFLCYNVLNKLGLTVEEIPIITVAWYEKETCRILGIPYIELPAQEMGKRAFEILLKRVSDRKHVPGILLRGEIRS